MEKPQFVYRGIPSLVIELYVAGANDDIFFPGDHIRGKLAITVKPENERIKRISIKLKGISEVRWIEPATRRGFFRFRKPVKVSCGQEIYCNYEKNLLESDGKTFNRGKHGFKFQFQLPKYSPSTFEGSFGYIRYLLTIDVVREDQLSESELLPDPTVHEDAIAPFTQSTAIKTTSVTTELSLEQLKEKMDADEEVFRNNAMSRELNLTVHAVYDLNEYPRCGLPLKLRSVKRYRRYACNLGRCETTVDVPVSGFCPGQTISVTLRCDNSTRLDMKDITFGVRMTVTYHGHDGDKRTKNTQQAIIEFHKASATPVKAHTILLQKVELKLERITKTYDVSICSLIDIDYDFVVTTWPKNKRYSEAIAFQKCILGNYPLRSTDIDNPSPSVAQNDEELVEEPSGPLPRPSSTHRSRYESSSDVSIDDDQFFDSDSQHNLRMSYRDRRHRSEPPPSSGVNPIKADTSNISTMVMIHYLPSKTSNPPELDLCTPGPSRLGPSKQELSNTDSPKAILPKLYTNGKPKASSYPNFDRRSASSHDTVSFGPEPAPNLNPLERITLPRVKSRTKNTIPTAPLE